MNQRIVLVVLSVYWRRDTLDTCAGTEGRAAVNDRRRCFVEEATEMKNFIRHIAVMGKSQIKSQINFIEMSNF